MSPLTFTFTCKGNQFFFTGTVQQAAKYAEDLANSERAAVVWDPIKDDCEIELIYPEDLPIRKAE